MKYFVRNQERMNTVYHEFQKGRFDEETFWKEDSLCLHDDYLHTLGLFQIFQNTIPDYSDTGESEIDEKLWNAVMHEAEKRVAKLWNAFWKQMHGYVIHCRNMEYLPLSVYERFERRSLCLNKTPSCGRSTILSRLLQR